MAKGMAEAATVRATMRRGVVVVRVVMRGAVGARAVEAVEAVKTVIEDTTSTEVRTEGSTVMHAGGPAATAGTLTPALTLALARAVAP